MWIYSVIGHITTGCPTKMNIERLLKGDDLIGLLKDKCCFRPIQNNEVSNIYTVHKLTGQK